MNTKLEYLYRDGGNNKKWGEVVFTNNKKIDLTLIKSGFGKALIEKEFFIAKQSGLPVLSFQESDEELDHEWYEYSDIKNTTEEVNDPHNRDITDFIKLLKESSSI